MALADLFRPTIGQPQPPRQVQPVAPTTAPPYMQTTLPATSFNMPAPAVTSNYALPVTATDYNSMLEGSLERFMDPNSAYIQNARQRGVEMAATRGGINSSIAAGAAERAAIEAATPLAQTATGMAAGEKSAFDQARLGEWASQQGFNRELYSMPFTSSLSMLQKVTDASLQDPELYSPSVVSGYTNFFNQQMGDMMRRYFGG